jgi:hypothetical protein
MKKFLLGLVAVVLLGAIYLFYSEMFYSPLDVIASEKIFGEDMDMDKLCDIDYLGSSSKGEFFELYKYEVGNVDIDRSLPDVHTWEKKELPKDAVIGKWKSCPIDSVSYQLYEFTLTANNWKEHECSNLLNEAMEDPNNYYSYIHVNELQQYFLLYSSKEGVRYYLRRKGF